MICSPAHASKPTRWPTAPSPTSSARGAAADNVSIAEAGARYADHWQRIGWVNAVIAGWQDNASLDQEELPGVPEPITKALRDAAAARALPTGPSPN